MYRIPYIGLLMVVGRFWCKLVEAVGSLVDLDGPPAGDFPTHLERHHPRHHRVL